MNNLHLDILHPRQPRINYVSPAVCENRVDNSSGFTYPVLLLGDLASAPKVQGVVIGFGDGTGGGIFKLNWGTVPGAICYTVYKLVDALDPFGVYSVIAECITDPTITITNQPPGTGDCYVITALTPTGLVTQVSDPICVNIPPGEPPKVCYPVPAIPCDPNPNNWPEAPLGGGGGGECLSMIWQAPTPITVDEFTNVTLGPVVTWGPAIKYEWYKDGVFFRDTTATTTNTLALTFVQEEDSGSYTLRVYPAVFGCSVLVSAPILLTVEACSAITNQGDTPVLVDSGDPVTLGPVLFTHTDHAIKYEWWKDGVLYSDTTATSLNTLIFATTVPTDSGSYVLKIYPDDEELCDVLESEPIVLTVSQDCPDWSDLLWDSATISTGGAGVAGFNPETTAQANFVVGAQSPDGSVDNASSSNQATLTYNGAGCNCNLHIEIVDSDGATANLCGGVSVIADGNPVLVEDVSDLAIGVYDFPFTLPDTLGVPISVIVQVSCQAPCFGAPAGLIQLAYSGVFSNV